MAKRYDPRRHGALCDECPLNGETVVPPEGDRYAELAIVGEAPGYNEVKLGRPFIGRSGRMLEDLLETNKLSRKEVWISNSILCKPPELKVGGGGEESSSDPSKLKLAMKCCQPRLHRELDRLSELKCIVAFGSTALRSLGAKNAKILKARGFIWDLEIEEKPVKVVPSVHPAFVLRAPAWEPVIGCDFERAVRIAQDKYQPIKFKQFLAPEATSVASVLSRLEKTVSVDIETTMDGATSCKLLCVGISDGKSSIVIPWASARDMKPYYGGHQTKVFNALRSSLTNKIVVTHNGPSFDQIVLARYGIDLVKGTKGWEDTLLAHHTFASHFPQRLDHVVSMYLDVPPWKIVSKKRANTSDDKGAWDPTKISDEDLHYYNALDCVFTIRAWQEMQSDLRPEMKVYEGDKRLAQLCRHMQEKGVYVDRKRQDALRSELGAEKLKYIRAIRKYVGFRIEPTKLVDVRRALFEVFGAPVLYRSLKTGNPSTNVDTLQAFAQSDHPAGKFCRLMLKWREVEKQLSTYVDGIEPEEDGRVHPNWRPYGAITGRLSCRGPNLQNLTQGNAIRSMYIAPPGRMLVGFDYRQLEMRIAAYLSGDSEFIKSCESEDIHASNAVVLFGALPDDPVERKKLRTVAKTAGFAVSYAAQATTVHARLIAGGYSITLHQVEVMLNRMRTKYKRYYEWQEENLKQVQRTGYIRLFMSGRKRWLGETPMPTEVSNTPIQGGAADLMNSTLPIIEDLLPRGAFVIGQVHDSGVNECDPSQTNKIQKIIKDVAERPIRIGNRYVRFPVECKIGHTWADV